MKIRNIVKVMNFHSLLHVDKAIRDTEKYIRMEEEVSKLMDLIVNNRNFVLDKVSLNPNPKLPPLNIYLGSDFSFCGALNSSVNKIMLSDDEADKIIVGRKLRMSGADKVLLSLTHEEFEADYYKVKELLEKSINQLSNSEINIIYNHYYNSGHIEARKKKLFPLPARNDMESYSEDFVVEGNIMDLLLHLTAMYVSYEVKIAGISSFASENIMRQNATTESLKKIDELEEEEIKQMRKEKKQDSFRKVQESFVSKRFFGYEGGNEN